MHTVAKAFAWVLNVYNPWENLYSPQEWLLLTLDFPWFVALFQATQCKPTFGPLISYYLMCEVIHWEIVSLHTNEHVQFQYHQSVPIIHIHIIILGILSHQIIS